ncbi:MAG: hypothetical protein NT149_02720 [Candidatus Gottesmanbacteria bacterium]|nr:hypothetical protein [Candidatus Gottesmanbacteria bacterium]
MNVEKLVATRIKIREIGFDASDKLLLREQAQEFISIAHDFGKTVILVEGTWDLTHAGHVQHIREAKKHADLVLLRLSSEEYSRRFKGVGRPIEVHRELVVSEFDNVDAVWVDDTAIPPDDIPANAEILAQLRMDGMTLETEDDKFSLKYQSVEYANHNLGANIKLVVMTLPYLNSTTSIIDKIRKI